MSVNWPPLVVRSWHSALYSGNSNYSYGWDHDPVQEAKISRRMHELRGLVVGQVAEIEFALLCIASEVRDRYEGPVHKRQKRKGAGGALDDVRGLLSVLPIGSALTQELDLIGQVIRRRNKLMHATIHVYFDRLGPYSGLEPVEYVLLENDANKASVSQGDDGNSNDSPFVSDSWDEGDGDDLPDDEMEYGIIGEMGLEEYLTEAYSALESALGIWKRVDEALPQRKFYSDPEGDEGLRRL